MDFLRKLRNFTWKFYSTVKIDIKRLNYSILKDLKNEKWPTNCLKKYKTINKYVQNVQYQILNYKKKKALNFVTSQIFAIQNRIFSIDKIFNESKNNTYNSVKINRSVVKSQKFFLLKQTKLINLSKLYSHRVTLFKPSKESKRLFQIHAYLDKILQYMFLNFLDIYVKKKIQSNIFTYNREQNARWVIANIYSAFCQVSFIKHINVCSIHLEKHFNQFFHNQIIKQYPFPKNYKPLLLYWLTSKYRHFNQNVENINKSNLGIAKSCVLAPSIVNFLLSKAFPENIVKRVNKQNLWAYTFSYANDILLVANNSKLFDYSLIILKKKLKRIGLILNDKKTKFFAPAKSRIKFQFSGFKFSILSKSQLRKNLLFFNRKIYHFSKQYSRDFEILFQPLLDRMEYVKKQFKTVIKRILYQSRKKMCMSFQKINSLLLNWGFYFYFNKGFDSGKWLDNYIFRSFKKILVQKFRYNGLLRPRWVAYNFLGLNKLNPNRKKWQPSIVSCFKNSHKVSKYVHIWRCQDSLFKLSIVFLLLNFRKDKENHYVFHCNFKKNIDQLIFKRLKSDLKVKLYDAIE